MDCREQGTEIANTLEIKVKTSMSFAAVMLVSSALSAQTQPPAATPAVTPISSAQVSAGASMGGGNCRDNLYNCAGAPNPLPPANTVWIEEMTWMDVRDAIKAGKTTVIVATGGMEPNGPWLVTGKHNYVNRANCEAIARKLGNALCAPLVKLVPEGSIEPKSSHMVSPGTLSLREATFRSMIFDLAQSFKAHGFKNIIFIGDSGGNQTGPRVISDSLTAIWKGNPVVAQVDDYYTYGAVGNHMETRGLVDGTGDGLHDDPVITLNMFITDPSSVRYDERVKADKATINGFSIADRVKSLELAREIVAFRAQFTVDAINRAIANKGTELRPARGARAGGGGAADTTAAGRAGGGGRRGGGAGADTTAAGRAAAAAGGGRRGGGGAVADTTAAGRAAAAARGGGGGGGAGRGGAAAGTGGPTNMGGGSCGTTGAAIYNCSNSKNPLPAATTIWLEELTWVDVRDARDAGKTTVIVPVGGIEPGGPWSTLGKPNVILRANCETIARKLGNALCAPIMDLIPQGGVEPVSGNMTTPGTISLRESTFAAVLTDVVHSIKMHGFKNIVLISSSTSPTALMKTVADTLNKRFAAAAKVIPVAEYATSTKGSPDVLVAQGVVKPIMPSDGVRDEAATTLNAMLIDPSAVRWQERVKTDQAVINGVSIANLNRSLQLAKLISDSRADRTVALIKLRIAAPR